MSNNNVRVRNDGLDYERLFSSRSLHMDYYWVHQKLSADFVPTELTYMYVVLSHKTPLQQ